MSEENKTSLGLHFTIGAIVLAIILLVLFWPNEPEPEVVVKQPTFIDKPDAPIIRDEPIEVTPEPKLENTPIVTEEPSPEPEPPKPLDTSDGTVKTKLLALSDYDAFARLLINQDLLQRFVVMTNNLADGEIPANNRVLNQPNKPFRTFRQADKEWIDPASYKRYAPYVEVFESLETASILQLYAEYEPAIQQIYAEIGDPSDSFNEKLHQAIDVLLDTPEVPVPVEVYTDSVMYKFADEQLESLSGPQKQLLRTGPENMRRIKAKLRELKEAL